MKQSILDDANTTDKLGDIIRRRNNPWYLDTEWEQKFGGKPLGSPVSTLYPNLIAEIAITDKPMSNVPDFAKISKEVFGAVVEATRRSLPSEFNKYLFQIVLAVLDTAHPLPDNLSPVIPYAYFRYCMRYFEAEIAEYEYRHKTDPMKGIRRKRMEAPE